MGDETKAKVIESNIPNELRKYPNWVLYKLPDKIPYDPKTGKRAKTTDPKTWGTCEQALKALNKGGYDGIGFVFSKNTGLTGIDLDHCIEDGNILPWGKKIIDNLNSYTEISPSGTGIHIITKGKKPGKSCRKGHVEIYDSGRFFTITGNLLPGCPVDVQDRQAELNALYDEIFGKSSPEPRPSSPPSKLSLSDEELVRKIEASEQGDKFKRLMSGDISGHGNDDSRADLALCSILAFWTQDPEQMDHIFRQSGLCRDKWDKRRGAGTYGSMTITKAIKKATEVYQPGGPHSDPAREKFQVEKVEELPQSDEDENRKYVEELNRKHAVLMIGGKCVVINETMDYTFKRPDITFSNPTDFKNFYTNRFVMVDKEKPNGTIKKVPLPLGHYWFSHRKRRQYKGIVFCSLPGPEGYYNFFKGYAVEPKQGNCDLYLEHIRDNITMGNEEYYNYVVAWMADLIQNPFEKKDTSIVLRGLQGTGKGIFVGGIGSLLGQHYVHVQHTRHLVGNFNAHLKDTLLVFADEVTWGGDRQAEGVLKAMVTEKQLTIESKGKDSFVIDNNIHLMIASNHEWVVPAGLEERRFFILDVGKEHMQDKVYFGKIINQMNHGGREALLYYLLHHDLSDIDLRTIPQTMALYEMKYLSMQPLEKFWFSKLDAGALLNAMDKWSEEPISIEKLLEEFREFIKNSGSKYMPDEKEMGVGLRKLVPGRLNKMRLRGPNNTRYHAYRFPPLEECREYWEELTKTKYKWSDKGVSLMIPSGFIEDEEEITY